jgi:hypothetical protein
MSTFDFHNLHPKKDRATKKSKLVSNKFTNQQHQNINKKQTSFFGEREFASQS